MQPFDNEELLEIFSSKDIPLDEFGTGMDGDGWRRENKEQPFYHHSG